MSNTTIYNNAGKTLIVDKIIERKTSKKQSDTVKERYYAQAIMQSNYSKLQEKLLEVASDNFLSTTEKSQLRKDVLSIDSTFASIIAQTQELKFNSEASDHYQTYLELNNNYDDFKEFINPFLETETPESIDSNFLETKLNNYYNSVSTIEQAIFQVLYGSTKKIDIELTSEFFVFEDANTPAYEPQTIQAYLKTWDLLENSTLYVNESLKEIPDTGIITISLEDITNLEEVSLRFVSGELEITKKIRKVFNGNDAIQIQIYSSDGNAFRVGQANTTLKAYVFKGEIDITDSLDDSLFSWKRKSSGTNLQDEIWNTSSKAIGSKTLLVTAEDTIGRTNFFCEVNI